MAQVFVLRRVARPLSSVAFGAAAASLLALSACGPPTSELGVDVDAASYLAFGEQDGDGGQSATPGPDSGANGSHVIGAPPDASAADARAPARDSGEDAPF